MSKPEIICVDFDGTIVRHNYPSIGIPVNLAIPTLRMMRSKGIKIILFTMRSGKQLKEAVNYIEGAGIQLYGVNSNPTQKNWTQSPKAYGHLYIDDAAFGCPLITPDNGERPYVDWEPIYNYINQL